jgi:hypothetical protein
MIPKPEKCTMRTQNVPNGDKYIPNGHKIFKMAIKYINIFQSEALEIFPKLEFLVWKKPSGNPERPRKP